MIGIFAYIYHTFKPNVGKSIKYSMHGSNGYGIIIGGSSRFLSAVNKNV